MNQDSIFKELDSETESKINRIALHYMSQSRPDRDIPHLEAVVFYMKELLKGEGGNERVLLPAIYFHDIGYAGLLEKGYNNNDNEKVKSLHMERGAEMARKHLKEIDSFTPEEIDQICYLVSIHDQFDKIIDFDSQMVFEADSLGQIDIDRVPPNFSKKDFLSWLESNFKTKRIPLFKTETGKKYLAELLPKAEHHFDEDRI